MLFVSQKYRHPIGEGAAWFMLVVWMKMVWRAILVQMLKRWH